MPKYYITEPALNLPASAYTHSGRGGAGNLLKVSDFNEATAALTKKSSTASKKSSSGAFYAGRGGAGNAHRAADRVALSFEDEYATAERHDEGTHQGHVGRGGAGNVYHSDKGSDAGSSRRDSASTRSGGSNGFWGRMSFSRN